MKFHGLRDQSVHNIKSLEGADILWVEEAQNVSKKSWRTVIPTIRKPGSEIWVTFNPELETDDTYQRFVVNPPPGSVVVKTSYEDNDYLSDELRLEIEHLRTTDPDEFEHVYEGMCRQAVAGAVYRNELLAADKEGRICRVPYDASKPVDTFWDAGSRAPVASPRPAAGSAGRRFLPPKTFRGCCSRPPQDGAYVKSLNPRS